MFFFSECKFIVHADCQTSVPPLCGVSYEVLAKAREEPVLIMPTTEKEDDSDDEHDRSTTLSLIPSNVLGPLSTKGLIYLPKLSDFEYIGHFGDGGCSHVYCVQHIQSKEYVAIKVVDGTDQLAQNQFEMERQILFHYSGDNPFMIKGYCSFHQGVRIEFLRLLFISIVLSFAE